MTIPVPPRKRCYTRDEVVVQLRARMAGRLRTQHAFARWLGISQPMLCQILGGRRMPGGRVLEKLRLVHVEHFEEG